MKPLLADICAAVVLMLLSLLVYSCRCFDNLSLIVGIVARLGYAFLVLRLFRALRELPRSS